VAELDEVFISAIHEAGHCVMKWRLVTEHDGVDGNPGFNFIRVRTADEVKSGSYVDARGQRYSGWGISDMPRFDQDGRPLGDLEDWLRPRSQARMEQDIMVAFAGPVCEARLSGCDVESLFEPGKAGCGDYKVVAVALVNMGLELEGQRRHQLLRDTQDRVADPRFWRTVEALARRVLAEDDRRLTGDQALPLLRRAWNEAS
jgi:hypothetical protein